jgi:PhnB protein
MEFYKAAFGAEELYRLTDPESGKVGHAELTINGSLVMLADEYPEYNRSARTLGGTPVRLCLMVDDADAAFQRAVDAGAKAVRPPADQFYGHRSGSLQDPYGHEWIVSQEKEKVAPADMQERWNAFAKSGGCQ